MSTLTMNKRWAVGVLFLSITATADGAEMSAALGVTTQGGIAARSGLGFDWGAAWFESTAGKLTGYWDVGYTYWQSGEEAGERHSLSLAPVFVYESSRGGVSPFIEAGIGVSLFSGSRAGNQDFGSAFNFEDRVGVGLKFGQAQRVGVRVIHYSNAGIAQPNDGIESYSLFYAHAM